MVTAKLPPIRGHTKRPAREATRGLGCRHRTIAQTLHVIQLEDAMADAEGRPPRTPCPCCGGGVAVAGVRPCVGCYHRERERQAAQVAA